VSLSLSHSHPFCFCLPSSSSSSRSLVLSPPLSIHNSDFMLFFCFCSSPRRAPSSAHTHTHSPTRCLSCVFSKNTSVFRLGKLACFLFLDCGIFPQISDPRLFPLCAAVFFSSAENSFTSLILCKCQVYFILQRFMQ